MVALGWLAGDGKPSKMAQANLKTPTQGAATTLWAVTSETLIGRTGVYCQDTDIAPVAGVDNNFSGVATYAADDENAEKLWDLSEKLLADA